MIDERRQADLGADGRGRLAIDAPAPDVVTLSEDAAGSPFGLKLAAVQSSLSGATVNGPAGAPAQVEVAVRGQSAARRDPRRHLHAAGRFAARP